MTEREFKTAMVLAAGCGERMRPLSEVIPKPALPLPDGPVVASALRLAAAAGATRLVVNVSHLAERMVEAVRASRVDGVEVVLSFEEELMGTAGGIALARDRGLLGDAGSLLVVNADSILGLDLEVLARRHFESDDLVTLALLPHLDPERWSRVVIDSGGLVETIHLPGRPAAAEVPLLYPGVMAVRRDAVDGLPPAPSEVPAALWGPARSSGRLGGAVVSGYWHEVGTPSDYLELMRMRLAGTTVIDPSATISLAADVTNSLVGRKVVVKDGAVVQDSVIVEGAVVGERARVVRSAIFGTVVIDPETILTDEVRAEPRSR